jgi:hypothetical protein
MHNNELAQQSMNIIEGSKKRGNEETKHTSTSSDAAQMQPAEHK